MPVKVENRGILLHFDPLSVILNLTGSEFLKFPSLLHQVAKFKGNLEMRG